MKVIQLRRLLRTLPPGMKVLLADMEGIFSAHDDDFEQLELSGEWGPKALVITPYKPPFRRHRPFKPAEESRPIERLRAQQRWAASSARRDAWREFAKDRAESGGKRTSAEEQLCELLARVTDENIHPPRLD
jgi:hypothetical protein